MYLAMMFAETWWVWMVALVTLVLFSGGVFQWLSTKVMWFEREKPRKVFVLAVTFALASAVLLVVSLVIRGQGGRKTQNTAVSRAW